MEFVTECRSLGCASDLRFAKALRALESVACMPLLTEVRYGVAKELLDSYNAGIQACQSAAQAEVV